MNENAPARLKEPKAEAVSLNRMMAAPQASRALPRPVQWAGAVPPTREGTVEIATRIKREHGVCTLKRSANPPVVRVVPYELWQVPHLAKFHH